MPNWCYNQTVFYGDKNKQKEIYEKTYEKYLSQQWSHIDLILKEFGCSKEELDKDFCVRAHITDLRLLENGELEMSYESAWNPINEILDEILKKYQPQMKQVTLADESGMDVFLNTDIEGKYFTEKYYLDLTITGEDETRKENYNDTKYHDSLESVVNELKDFFGFYDFSNEEMDTEEQITSVIEKLEEYDDIYITFANFF